MLYVFQITAFDEDLEVNSHLTYFIEDGNSEELFKLYPNGTFWILQTLDREVQSHHILTIIAVDSGNNTFNFSVIQHRVII